ncbi:MAG: hypothetical protein MHM6MM_002677 [Cercozoa sp. M6MM]
MDNDPFFLLQRKIQQALGRLQDDVALWRKVRDSENTYRNERYERLKHQATATLKKVEKRVKSAQNAVAAVEADRARFVHIDDGELDRRRAFAAEAHGIVSECREQLRSHETTQKERRDEQSARRVDRARDTVQQEVDRHNVDFVTQQQQQLEETRAEQDEVMDDMLASLQRLGVMTDDMNQELTEHNELLGEIEDRADEVSARMEHAMQMMHKILGTRSRKYICLIFVLMAVLLLMTYFAFFV